MTDADDAVELLGLRPHPEGGSFREIWREPGGTAIYYLLRADERSHWHRVDRTEIWHFYAGAALELRLSSDGHAVERHLLGVDLRAGHRPQRAVPAGTWQAARSLGGWTLVGCTVFPAFDFAGFELAPPDWHPSGA